MYGILSRSDDLAALTKLLNPEDEEGADGSLSLPEPTAFTSPAALGPSLSSEPPASAGKQNSSKDIWNEEEVPDKDDIGTLDEDDPSDTRQSPEYTILYKQRVSAQDIFLGMSEKDPSSRCCEDLVVRIMLPKTQYSQIDLKVLPHVLHVETPLHKLKLYLPHKVDDVNGSAKWDSSACTLSCTLPIERDED
mmetsp:Transcript_40747/g.66080  ORF Transcript_40747/g.66080 Transcript_40747/m.66080 type:complete len:192 (-) Transcript_40747:323-898(-)